MPASIIPQKAALYIRVSTDEQARHGYSLAEQKHDLEQHAARKGYAVIGVYADEGISARKLYKHRPADTVTYLFSGLIVCPCCGRTLEARKGYKTKDGTYKYYIYVCGRRYNDGSKEHCDYSTGMSEARVERWLVAHLQQELAAYIATAKRQTHKPKNHAPRIKTLRQKLDRLKELYVDSLIDKDTYKRDYDSIQTELSAIAREQATIRTFPRQYSEIMQGDNFAEVYGKLSREGKRRFWRAIISRIEFDYVRVRKGHEIPFRITFR